MALAVVIATEVVEEGAGTGSGPKPSAALPLSDGTTVLERLRDQLSSLGIGDTHVITRPDLAPLIRKNGHDVVESDDLSGDLRKIARLVRTAAGKPVLILHGDVVAHREVFARVVLSSKGNATAVIARGRPNGTEPVRPVIRVTKGRVVSAGSPYHQVTDPNAVFRGVLRVAGHEATLLAQAADQLADLLDTPGALTRPDPIRYLRYDPQQPVPDDDDVAAGDDALDADGDDALPEPLPVLGSTATTGDDALALILVGLTRSGAVVQTRRVRKLICDRILNPEQADAAQSAVEEVDEDRLRLNAAVKSNDGFFTTYAVSTYSRFIARWCARRQMTPNMVTSISMAISILAAVWFAAGSRIGMIVGAVLLYFAFVFDCVDGQLARYTRQFSTLGAWLDATFDRAKEYVVYAGLAMGATAAAVSSSVHAGDVWGLAIAAITLQTCRHMVDFSFGAAKRRVPPQPIPVLPLAAPDDSVLDPPELHKRAGGRGHIGHLVVWLSGRAEKIPGLRWTKKIIVLPIGERFALIALTAALFNAKVTFIALLGWGGVAACYTITGRILRSLTK